MAKKMYVGIGEIFTPVEYIETSGPQYVNTEVLMKDTLKIEAEFYDVNGYGFWYGARREVGNTFPGITATTSDSDSTHRFTYGGVANSGDFIKFATQLNEWHRVSHSQTLYIDDNLVITFNNSTFSEETSLYIFAMYEITNKYTNIYTGNNPVRMKSFKVYDNNVLIRDFIPVLDENNVACLLDIIQNKAYYNIGTGTFTAGLPTGEPLNIGKARKIIKAYVGVNSKARKNIKGYVGVNGIAHQFYESI